MAPSVAFQEPVDELYCVLFPGKGEVRRPETRFPRLYPEVTFLLRQQDSERTGFRDST